MRFEIEFGTGFLHSEGRRAIAMQGGSLWEHRPYSVMTFDFRDDRIQSVFIVVNPDKLKQLADFKYQLGLTNDIMSS